MDRRIAKIKRHNNGLLRVGFWWSEEDPTLPHPKDFVDPEWPEQERDQVLAYLDSAYMMNYAYAGRSWCRLGCPRAARDMGSLDLTDGVWLFPEGLAHYLRTHQVKPCGEFLEHIRKSGYKIPNL